MLTPEVEAEVLVLLSSELERLNMFLSPDGKLVLGTCQDGLVLVFPALGMDGQKRMNLVRVSEPALRSTGSQLLIQYFEDNRSDSKQSIEEFALSFAAGWNRRAGRLN